MQPEKKRWLRDSFKGALLPVVSCVITLALGITGYIQYYGVNGVTLDVMQRALYDTLQLFILEYDFDKNHNILIKLASWTGTVLLIWGATKIYVAVFRRTILYRRISLWKNHVILYGASEHARHTLESFIQAEPKTRIVYIDTNESTREWLSTRYVIHISPSDSPFSRLRLAGVGRAKYLIATTSDDITNIHILRLALDIKKESTSSLLLAWAHISNTKLLAELNDLDVVTKTTPYFDGRLYNGYYNAARIIGKKFAPDIFAPVHYQKSAEYVTKPRHCLVVGFGDFGEALTMQLIRIGQFIDCQKIRLTIIDRKAESNKMDFYTRYPDLPLIADVDFKQHLSESSSSRQSQYQEFIGSISVVYLCQNNISEQILTFHALRQTLAKRIFYIICHNDDLPPLSGITQAQNVIAINPFFQAYDKKVIIEEELEALARHFHLCYLRREQDIFDQKKQDFRQRYQRGECTIDAEPRPKPAMVPWNELPEEIKVSNRSLAEHIPVKLRAIGCELAPLHDTRPEYDFTSDVEVVYQLARMEHNRWMADKIMSGWTYGERDDERKLHDNLLPWQELSPDIQQYDINAIKEIPAMLAENGLKVCRLIEKK
ncbi:hypothetical protein EH223_01680 [candidate division KSB1 bacterium]|nr:NAD-binding protein [candidate division KSB1 bacterium]RQW06908.1 MAG: hypothetical protein EH223_01680 [candidate division KSB1 bacterium]